MTLVFTLCSNNYLAQANALGQSLLFHNPHYAFKIGLVDKKIIQIDYTAIQFEIVEVESIKMAAFNGMFKRYSITELNTAVKPYFINYFFDNFKDYDSIIYLDPDIYVYSSFSALDNQLKRQDIILTPHCRSSINDNQLPSENEFLNAGLYNLGFIALKKGSESKKLINWWSSRLETKAYIDFANGMFTDQIWLNFAPLFYENVGILEHPGYNMAYWNLHERFLTDKYEIKYKEQFYPLVFFHFSGYDPIKTEIISKYQNWFSFVSRKDIADLFKEYTEVLLKINYTQYIQYPCYYEEEKKRIEAESYLAFKRSIPLYKRLLRGIILRIIKIFKISINYYTH